MDLPNSSNPGLCSALLSHRGWKLSVTRLLPSFKWITSSPDYLLYRWRLRYYLLYYTSSKKKKHNISRKVLANSDAYSIVPFNKLWTFRMPTSTVSFVNVEISVLSAERVKELTVSSVKFGLKIMFYAHFRTGFWANLGQKYTWKCFHNVFLVCDTREDSQPVSVW